MIRKLAIAASLLITGTANAQTVDTVRGVVGDTLRPGFTSAAPGCWQIQRVGPGSGRPIVERGVGCWAARPAPPPPDTQPAPPAPPTQPGGYTFVADWSFRTGTDSQAVMDGRRFNFLGTAGPMPRCRVVTAASTGLPFPTANVLEVPAGTDRGWCFPRKTNMDTLRVGDTRYYRVYLVNLVGASTDPQSHPIQDGHAGSQINWEIAIRHDATDTPDFVFQFQFHTNNGWPYYIINLRQRLQKRTVYRIEWAVTRVSAAEFTFEPRVYSATGAQLYGASDFVFEAGRAGYSTSYRFRFNNPANLAGINTGTNQGWMPPGSLYGYQAGLCIRPSTWCGPYSAAEASWGR